MRFFPSFTTFIVAILVLVCVISTAMAWWRVYQLEHEVTRAWNQQIAIHQAWMRGTEWCRVYAPMEVRDRCLEAHMVTTVQLPGAT
jgi:hypothetical protein